MWMSGMRGAIVLLSCIALFLAGYLWITLREGQGKSLAASNIRRQFENLEMLSANMTGELKDLRGVLRKIAAASERLLREITFMKASVELFPVDKRSQLMTELTAIERSCTLLLQQTRDVEAVYGNEPTGEA